MHLLGAVALADWRRALARGGRIGFTLPMADEFRPSGAFAALVATDLRLPRGEGDVCALAVDAGFVDPYARVVRVEQRRVIAATASIGGLPDTGKLP